MLFVQDTTMVVVVFFFSSRRRHTRCSRDWSSDVCSSDLGMRRKTAMCWPLSLRSSGGVAARLNGSTGVCRGAGERHEQATPSPADCRTADQDRKSTRLNSSHGYISYAVFCLKKKKNTDTVMTDTNRNQPPLMYTQT